MAKLLLIDGNSILNRAFYGLPDLTNSEGLHTNAVLGFLNILFRMMEEEQPDFLTVAFDLRAPTFRHKLYKEYKGTRKAMPEELREQVPCMKECLRAMGVQIAEMEGYEADDILGTMARMGEKQGLDVVILSGDRDLLQLATEHILIRIPKTKKGVTEIENYYGEQVKELYGVTPLEFIDMKALMGDASDNIPGVPGIGEKTAGKLIAAYHSVENAYAHVEEITPAKAREALKNHYELAKLSRVLAEIKTDCPLPATIEEGKTGKLSELFTKEAREIFTKLEFKSIIHKYFSEEAEASGLDERFAAVSDFAEADRILKKAAGAQRIGAACVWDGRLLGLSLTFSDSDMESGGKSFWKSFWIEAGGFLTEEYLLEEYRKITESVPVIDYMDLKGQIRFQGDEYTGREMDISIAAYLLNPLKDSYTCEEIAGEYLGLAIPSKEELFKKQKLSDAVLEKPEELKRYVCYLSCIPYLADETMRKRLKAAGMWELYQKVETPLIYTLAHMEQAGIRVKKEELLAYGEKLAARIAEVEEAIYKQAGERFNINSPKQLGELLFGKMKLKGGKKTKTGYSTAADVLEKLAPEQPVIRDVLEYRQLTKLKSTYADGLAGYIGEDNRIHSNFNQTITATGRISSTEPNLQNIPVKMALGREIRRVFVPEEGYVFVDADYSQIELRVLAHMSGDERLIEAYRQDSDIHRVTASQVFHVPFDEVTSLQRRNAKAVNFGIVYGISSFGLSQDLSITRKEAEDYIGKYFAAYPGIKQFLDRLVADAKEKGESVTMFGRKRPIPELKSSNFMQRSFGERIAMNAPIQGTAADIIKIAMVRVDERLRREKLESRLLLQIHDELLIEAKEEEAEKVQEILKEEMQGAANLKVALEISMSTGKSWFETK